jgi:hypothetical protein
MKIYQLNGKIQTIVPSIEIDGKIVNNPTDEQLIAAGCIITNIGNKRIKYTNIDERIDYNCQKHSDNLFIKYLIFKELGDTEQAEYFKNRWLRKRTSIKNVCKNIRRERKVKEENTEIKQIVTNIDTDTSESVSENVQ